MDEGKDASRLGKSMKRLDHWKHKKETPARVQGQNHSTCEKISGDISKIKSRHQRVVMSRLVVVERRGICFMAKIIGLLSAWPTAMEKS